MEESGASNEAQKAGCLRATLARLGLAAFSLLITFALLEGFARLIFARQQHQAGQSEAVRLYRQDDRLEWSLVPNGRMTTVTDDGEVLIEINSHGLRDREYDYEKPENTFRILILGDSFTEAMQVNLEDTYHARLERRLNEELGAATGLRFEVISGGVAAYGVTREMIFYEEEGRRYQPDLVLMAFYMGNDVRDDHPALAQEEPFPGIYRRQFFQIGEDGELEPLVQAADESLAPGAAQAQAQAGSLVRRIDAWLYGHSRLYFYVRPFLSEQVPFIRRMLYAIGFVQSPAPVLPRYSDTDTEVIEEAWALEEALIARLRRDVEADGATYAIIIIPDALQIQPETLREKYPLFYPALLESMDLEKPDRALMGILNRQGIPYLRLYPAFIEYRTETGETLYGSHGHWTVAGHRLAADLIYEWLVRERLVPGGEG